MASPARGKRSARAFQIRPLLDTLRGGRELLFGTSNTWMGFRRPDLRVVYEGLLEPLSSDSSLDLLPPFPRKKFFGNKDKTFVSKRRSDLQIYFDMLLEDADATVLQACTTLFRLERNLGGMWESQPAKVMDALDSFIDGGIIQPTPSANAGTARVTAWRSADLFADKIMPEPEPEPESSELSFASRRGTAPASIRASRHQTARSQALPTPVRRSPPAHSATFSHSVPPFDPLSPTISKGASPKAVLRTAISPASATPPSSSSPVYYP